MGADVTRRTGNQGKKHGQGSKSIKSLVANHESGILWVFSNFGLFQYENENKRPYYNDYKESINGTLIQWNIKVPNETSNKNY